MQIPLRPGRAPRAASFKHAVLALLLFGLTVTSNSVHAQFAPTGVYEPGAEGEIWRFIGSLGKSFSERCAAGGYDANVECPYWPEDDELWNPIGFDVYDDGTLDNYRVYVADRFNWRVLVYDYHGNYIRTIADFAGLNGVDDSLAEPEGLTVDAAGNLIVADTLNERVVVFDGNGLYRFEIPLGVDVLPAQVAVMPGTTVAGPPLACASPGPVAVAVTTWSRLPLLRDPSQDITDKNQVLLYDANMCRVGQLGQAHAATPPPPGGNFYLPGAPAFGPLGEVYVGAYAEDKIEVFLPDAAAPGGYVRGLGVNTEQPNSTLRNPQGDAVLLDGPYGVMIDSRGRLVVGDTNNNRIAVLLQPWHPENSTPRDPANPAIGTGWQFAFQLVADGNMAGSWLATVREDARGRWLVTSVMRDVLFAFEVPELAVIRTAAGQVATMGGDMLRVRGNIVVPVGKSALTDVVPHIALDLVQPPENRASLGPALGPYLAAPTADVFIDGYEGLAIDDIDNLQPGHYAQVYWDFPLQSQGQAQFWISASKSVSTNDSVTAEAKPALGESVPADCAAPLLSAPLFDKTPMSIYDGATGTFVNVYGNPVTVTLSASAPNGVREIQYEYLDGLQNGAQGSIAGASGSLVVGLPYQGSAFRTIRYRARAQCGADSAWLTMRFKVDGRAPRLAFGPVTPDSSGTDPDGHKWYSAGAVAMQVIATDDDTFDSRVIFPDFPSVADGRLTLLFTAEGHSQRQLVRVQDPLGNEFGEWSNIFQSINIDRTAPTLTLQPAIAPNANGWYHSDVPFDVVAEDAPALAGVKMLTSPGGLTIAPGATRHRVAGISTLAGEGTGLTMSAMAVDYANNSRTVVSNGVNIDRSPPVAQSVTDSTQVYTGQVIVTLAAADSPATAGATPSGIAKIFYSVAGGTPQEYAAPFALTTPGQVAVEVWAVDRADNIGARRTYVYAVNSAPTAPAASFMTNEDVTANVAVIAADADGDALTYAVTTSPQHGTLAWSTSSGAGTYTPQPNYNGPDSFVVRVSDGRGGSVSTTVSINVVPINDAPTAAGLIVSTIETQPVMVAPVYSDIDAGDILRLSLASGPGNEPVGGSVVQSGQVFIYTAHAGFIGNDSFKYVVTDAAGAIAVATIAVTVRASNQDPVCGNAVATPGLIWPPNHRPVDVAIGGIVDPDGDPLSIVVTRILQDEPTNTAGDGNTSTDGGGIGTTTAWVRAERMGPQSDGSYNNGRVYEIFFTASDGRDGVCHGSVTVGVPHDGRLGANVVDNGCRWDSSTGSLLSCAPGAQPPRPTNRGK